MDPTAMKSFIASNVAPDLAFIMDDVELELKYQYELVKAGYKTVRRVAALEDTPASARSAIRSILNLDPTLGRSSGWPSRSS